jgi:hypothetical protein
MFCQNLYATFKHIKLAIYFHDDGLKFPILKSKDIVGKYFSKLLCEKSLKIFPKTSIWTPQVCIKIV